MAILTNFVIITQVKKINGKKSESSKIFPGMMHDQESFVDSARWQKSGVKSAVFTMSQFSNFNNGFFLTLIDHILLRKYCWLLMELAEG